MALADVGVAAERVVLVGDPHDQDDVERRRRVVEELRHDRLHPCTQSHDETRQRQNIRHVWQRFAALRSGGSLDTAVRCVTQRNAT